jgi:hypothetical protein
LPNRTPDLINESIGTIISLHLLQEKQNYSSKDCYSIFYPYPKLDPVS